MQAPGRLVSHEVVEHFATLLKQGDVPWGGEPGEAKSSPENVVRPAAFNKGNDFKAGAAAPDVLEGNDVSSQIGEPPAREARVEKGDRQVEPGAGRPDPGDVGGSDFAAILEKIEAAGTSMRLAEERANRQAAWIQDFLATAKTRLREAERQVQEAERRGELLEKRTETAERGRENAEKRCRAAEKRLETTEKRLEVTEQRLESVLELARQAESRHAEATARAVDAERWMQEVLQTVQKEFPAAQLP